MFDNPWTVGITASEFVENPLNPKVILSMFAHAGIFHILGNMLFLYKYGDNVEAAMGRLRYLLFYLACCYVAVAAQMLFASATGLPRQMLAPMVGASGAISGVLGAYIYLWPGSSTYRCFCIRYACYCRKMAARYDIAIWAGFQFLLPLLEPSVAVFAHTGGLIAGVALAPLFAKRENVERLREDIREGKFRGLQPEGDEVIIKGWDGVVKAVLAAVVFVVLIIAILGVKSHTWQVYSVKFKSSGYVEEAVKPGPPRPMTVEKVVVYSESCYPMTQLPTCTFQNGQVYCSSIIIPGCPVVDRYILVRHGPATNAGVVASIAALAAISLQLARAVRTQREWEIL